jgi:hypothetical protein
LKTTKRFFRLSFDLEASPFAQVCFIMICKGVVFQEYEGIYHMEENVKLVYERYVL